MTGTVFSATDVGTGAGYNVPILTNGNKTCQLTSNNNNTTVDVCVDSQSSGKYYFEVTIDAGASRGIALGLITAGQSRQLGSGSLSSSGCALVTNGGSVQVNGSTLATITGFSNGGIYGFAWDFGLTKFWARAGAAGNWDNNGAHDPVTNVGGFSFSALAGALKPIVWMCSFSSPNCQVTLNMGDSAFGGVTPSGYTAGWPAPGGGGGASSSNMLLLH